jgi:hypothetical protein
MLAEGFPNMLMVLGPHSEPGNISRSASRRASRSLILPRHD